MKEFPDADADLVRKLLEAGYTEEEIKQMLTDLRQNAQNKKIRESYRWIYIEHQLESILKRYEEAKKTEQYQQLKDYGYTDAQLRQLLANNYQSMQNLLTRIESSKKSGMYDKLLKDGGFSEDEVRKMLMAALTESNMRTILERIKEARKYGVDAQGMIEQQIRDMLFNDRVERSKQKEQPGKGKGIIEALLSGDLAVRQEGEVARCIQDLVTKFNVPYGPNQDGSEIDVETNDIIIEVKTGHAEMEQLYDRLGEALWLNPGVKKRVILYGPGIDDNSMRSIKKQIEKFLENSRFRDDPDSVIGNDPFEIARSCEELHKQIRKWGE